MQRKFFVLALLASAPLFISCEDNITSRDIERQEEAVDVAKQDVRREQEQLSAINERASVETKIENDLNTLDAEIDRMEARAKEADEARRAELEREAAALRAEYDTIRRGLDELKAASGDSWASAKIAIEDSWKQLSESVRTTLERWDREQ